MPLNRLVSFLLLIMERGNGCYALYSLTHKGEGICLSEFIYLSILYLNKKRGFGVATCISTFVPILYHIYKRLSSDLNTYFKIIFYFFTHKGEGKWCIPIISYSLLIKERGNGVFQLSLILYS